MMDMSIATPREGKLTVAAAVAFVLCVGVVSTLSLVGYRSILIVSLSAILFLYLYAGS